MRVATVVISFLVLVIFSFLFSPVTFAASPITVNLNGKQIQYDTEPEIINSRTLVPVRHTVEAMDFQVGWDRIKKIVTIEKGNTIIKLQIDNKKAYRNGIGFDLDTAPYIKNSRTYLPVRFLSEAFGYEVNWVHQSRTVNIIEPLNQSPSNQTVPVLMYHHLSETVANGANIPVANFQKHMEALVAEGYSTITETDLYSFLQQETPLPDNPVLITFDDGYKSNYTYAYPILKKLGMKATIYLITSRVVEEENKFPAEIPKLSWKEALQASDVFSYQSHTDDSHIRGVNEKGEKRGVITGRMVKADGNLEIQAEFDLRLLEDLRLSKQMIEEKIGQEVISIAYPYGDYSEDTIKISKEAGFKMAFTIVSGKVEKGEDIFQLQRISVNGNMTENELIDKINSY